MSKRKAIRIKPEFREKLKKLKCLTAFIANSKDPKWVSLSQEVEERMRGQAEDAESFFLFVFLAFNWGRQKEGGAYWSQIGKNA